MAGRINEEDIQTVRERARIDEIVGSYVTLKPSGAGTLKGLCPFHDEKTPSFQVTTTRNLYYCFGCSEGGDVIDFVMKINNLSFTEALEQLADRVGVVLRYVDGDGGPRVEPGLRTRIHAANTEAAEFYARALLTTQEALPGRLMLDERGFDKQAAETFGVGWAPRGGRELTNHLRRKGFSDDVLIKAGLTRQGGWDFFQGRVLWPIRDSGKAVLGFGARRVLDDDRLPAKYINTPETPVYKKSHVLYGLDVARQAIGKKEQAVVVEGYTDVMAAHLSGVDTAVASCGTAFGEDHAKLLQRLMGAAGDGQGEVIFTFDGDAAGRAAALKVFKLDRAFTAQTYVAVEPSGLDPCDLRMQQGEQAVRELVGRRVPLYRFVMRNVLEQYDLDRADARLTALRQAAPLVTSVRDKSMVNAYARELAGMLGMPEAEVVAEVRRAASRGAVADPTPDVVHVAPAPDEGSAPEAPAEAFPQPDPHNRALAVERDVAKLLVQSPEHFTEDWNGIDADDFSHPGYLAIWRAVQAAGPRGESWGRRLREAADSDAARALLTAVAVEPLMRPATPSYVDEYAARLQLLRTNYDINQLKGRMQRMNAVEQEREHTALFTQLVALESRRKQLLQRSIAM